MQKQKKKKYENLEIKFKENMSKSELNIQDIKIKENEIKELKQKLEEKKKKKKIKKKKFNSQCLIICGYLTLLLKMKLSDYLTQGNKNHKR